MPSWIHPWKFQTNSFFQQIAYFFLWGGSECRVRGKECLDVSQIYFKGWNNNNNNNTKVLIITEVIYLAKMLWDGTISATVGSVLSFIKRANVLLISKEKFIMQFRVIRTTQAHLTHRHKIDFCSYICKSRLPTGWTVRGSNPGGERFSAPVQTGPEAHPASCTMGTGSFLGVRCCRGVTLTPHPLLVQRSKIE